jgi:hypothetical protein
VLLEVLLWLAIFVVAMVGVRRRREYRFIVLLALAGILVEAVSMGPRPTDLRATPIALMLLAGLAAAAVDVLRTYTRSRQSETSDRRQAWAFDQAMYREVQALVESLQSRSSTPDLPTESTPDQAMVGADRTALERLRRLEAPNSEWESLRREYVDIYRELIDRGEDGDLVEADLLDRRRKIADQRWVELRRAYVDRQAAPRQ